ncbi:MAG: Spy/CpxP family protein refolding chaperone [Ferruginibacter sp.]
MMKTNNSSNKIFIIVIALLLIANIVTLTMLLANKKPYAEDRKNTMRNYLKTEVGFTDAQLNAFDTVKTKHRAEVKIMFDEIRLNKQHNLKRIGLDNFSDSSVKVAAFYAATQQQHLETKMLNHLKDIRNLCTPAQRANFDTGFYKIMSRPSTDAKKN